MDFAAGHPRMRNALRVGVAALLVLLSISCSDTKSPSTPTPIDLTGTWTGDLTVQGQTARMTWVLTQQPNGTVTGPVTVTLPSGTVLLNGFLTGTLSGSTLNYTISIASGGIPSVPTCAGQLSGSTSPAIGTPSTLTGTYTVVSSTCQAPLTSGTLTLTRP